MIKATERCEFSNSLNNINSNQVSADCDLNANSLTQFGEKIASMTSQENSEEKFLRVVKTAQY